MEYIAIIGLIAAVFSTISLMPQLIRVKRTKSTKDISTGMFSLICGGQLLWFLYGWFVHDWPLIGSNTIAFLQAVTILGFKMKYR